MRKFPRAARMLENRPSDVKTRFVGAGMATDQGMKKRSWKG
jgi:hypothetical protein